MRARSLAHAVTAVFLLVVAGCSGSASHPDAGASDAGASAVDAGNPDAGAADSGAADAGGQDAGSDAGGLLLPGAPTDVIADAGIRSAFVSWMPPTNLGVPPLRAYVVTAWAGADAGSETVVPAPASSVFLTGLANGSDYVFTVAAASDAGAGPVSAPSQPVSTPPLPAPPVLTVQSPVTSGVDGWAAWVTVESGTTYAWVLDAGTFTNASGAAGDLVGTANAITYIPGPPGLITIECTAQDAVGVSAPAVATVEALAFPSTPVINAANPVVTGSTGNAAQVSGDIGDAYVCSATNAVLTAGATGTLADGGAALAFDVTQSAGAVVDLSCTETNAAGTRSLPGTLQLSIVIGPPSAPSGVSAVGGVEVATVTWSPPGSNGGSPLAGYVVTPWVSGMPLAPIDVGAAQTQLSLSGLTPDVTYVFTVAALNALGQGPDSAPSAEILVLGPPSASTSTVTASPATVPADGRTSTLLTVTLRDSMSEPVPGQTALLSSSGSGNVFTPPVPSGTTDANGSFTAALVSVHAETKTVTATFGGLQVSTTVQFGAPSCQPLYGSVPEPAAGPVPFAVATGDFDGDGHADFAIANSGSNTVSVLLGTGRGTFLGPLSFIAGSAPESLLAADLNGDGHLDLAVANSGGANVAVMYGRGDGTLNDPVVYPVGSAPNALAAGDFNRDGVLDLAVTNSRDNTVGVLLGVPDGGFQQQATFLGVSNPQGLVAADVNDDGRLDLCVANYGTGSVGVFLGNGDGTFQFPTTFSVGGAALSLAVADFNADGRLDFAVANSNTASGPGEISVLLGLGDAGWGPPTLYPATSFPTSVLAADVNADGIPDIVATEEYSSTVTVLFGRGDGTFVTAPDFPTGPAPQMVAAADFDGDGRLDLVTANYNGNNATVLLGLSDAGFLVPSQYPMSGAENLVSADFNGDGAWDLAVLTSGAGLNILLGRGDGTLGTGSSYSIPSGTQGIATADVNRDGHVDLLAADSVGVTVLLGNGDGTFQQPVSYPAGSTSAISVAVGDFNRDGHPDIAALDSVSTVSVLLGMAGGSFGSPVSYGIGSNPVWIVTADFNGDGALDLAITDESQGAVSVLLGHGDGTFASAVSYAAGGFPKWVDAADFNGDGAIDLVVSSYSGATVLFGNGDGTFAAPVGFGTGGIPWQLAAVASRPDGGTDIAASNPQFQSLAVLLNAGNGRFDAPLNYVVADKPYWLGSGDFDGDGQIDFAAAGGGNAVSILRYLGCR